MAGSGSCPVCRLPGQTLRHFRQQGEFAAVASVADRASSYGMPGVRVTENDPDLIFEAVARRSRVRRRGEGPTLLEVKVRSAVWHFQGDPETYRPKGEVESLRKKDSLAAYETRLKADGVVTDASASEIRGRAKARVEAAIAFRETKRLTRQLRKRFSTCSRSPRHERREDSQQAPLPGDGRKASSRRWSATHA